MDMFKSEKEKELLIISLIWVLGQLTGSPSCFASHSVVYAVTLFTKSPLTQDLFQSSCVWNLLAFVGVGGGGGRLGRWGQVALSPLEVKRHLHYGYFPWHLCHPRKRSWKSLEWTGNSYVRGSMSGQELAKSVPSIFPGPLTSVAS